MKHAVLPQKSDEWFRHLFRARAALDGGVVRRKTRNMEAIVGRAAFEREIKRRGYTAVENAGQIIIFCNAEPVTVIVS